MECKSKERLRAVLSSFESRGREQKEETIQLSPDEIRFKSLLVVMEKSYISFRQAVRIVGGTERLIRMLEDGTVRGQKPDGAINNKWKINAADCYRNVKPRLKLIQMN